MVELKGHQQQETEGELQLLLYACYDWQDPGPQ